MKRSAGVRKALMAVGALLSPAFASAQLSVYGEVNLSLDRLDNGERLSTELSDNASRVGIRGAHELGNGNAFFQLEMGVEVSSGSSELSARDSFVGLRGDLGLLRAGYFDTPMKTMGSNVDLFGNQLGSARNLTRNRPLIDVSDQLGQGFDERIRNSVHYRTPPLGNWMVDVHYGVGDERDDEGSDPEEENALSVALSYRNGGMYMAFAREDYEERRADRFVWGYEANALRVVSLYQRAEDPDDVVWGLGARYRPQDTAFRIQYYRLETDERRRDAELLAVGLEFALSSNLTSYLSYGQVKNRRAQSLTPFEEGRSGAMLDVEAGQRVSGWSLGMGYRF